MTARAAWILALAATLTMAVSYFDRQALGALAPAVKEGLSISNQRYGWLVSAFSIAYLIGSPLAGRLIDTIGSRRGLLGAVLAWTVVAALHALVPSFTVLFLLRIGLGFAEAPSFPGAAQTVQRAIPPKSRARAFGLLFTGSSIGALIAPLAASALADRFGWRIAFLATAVAGLVWVPLWLAVTRSAEARALLGPRAREASRPSDGFGDLLATIQHPAVLRASVIVVTSAPAVSFALNWGSSYLHDVFHVEQRDVGHYLWLPPLFFDAGALAFGHLASVRGEKSGTPPRLLVAIAAALGTLMCFAVLSRTPWEVVLWMGASIAGVGGLFALLTSDMLSRVDPRFVSSASGVTAAMQSLAYIVSNPIVGAVRDKTGGYFGQTIVLGALILPGALAWIMWPPPPRWDKGE